MLATPDFSGVPTATFRIPPIGDGRRTFFALGRPFGPAENGKNIGSLFRPLRGDFRSEAAGLRRDPGFATSHFITDSGVSAILNSSLPEMHIGGT